MYTSQLQMIKFRQHNLPFLSPQSLFLLGGRPVFQCFWPLGNQATLLNESSPLPSLHFEKFLWFLLDCRVGVDRRVGGVDEEIQSSGTKNLEVLQYIGQLYTMSYPELNSSFKYPTRQSQM